MKNTLTINELTAQGIELVKDIKLASEYEEQFVENFKKVLVGMKEEYVKLKPLTNSEVEILKLDEKLVSEYIKFVEEVKVETVEAVKTKRKVTKPKKKAVDTNPKWDEEILVVKRDILFENETLTFDGVESDEDKVAKIVSNLADNYTVMRRGNTADTTEKEKNAEINEEFKQPIPYALLQRNDEVYVYERLSGGGESRLQGKLSIGLGGHMNKFESDDFNETLLENLNRELEEELTLTNVTERELTYNGLINDDANEVGKVHLGILASIKLNDDAVVEVRETDSLRGEWMTVKQLKGHDVYDRLESWSKLAVDAL